MKIRSTRWMVAVAAGLALAGEGRADTVVYTFTQTFSLTASPTGATPQINTTWNVPKYNGFAASTSLTKVQYDVSTQITYSGTMVPLAASQAFNLQIRSDFNFDLPNLTPDVTALDPSITQGGTSGLANVYFTTGTLTSAANSATQLASDLINYVGVGTVAVPVTGSLLTTASGGSYQNNSDIGMASPYVFVDQNKIFPVFGLQQYGLVATMTVTYTVPETGTYAAAGFVALLVGHQWMRRRKARARLSPARGAIGLRWQGLRKAATPL